MKIRDKLYASTVVSIILIVILTTAIFITSDKIAEKEEEYTETIELYMGITELNIVTYEYLMHHEERMEDQWNLKYASLKETLEKGNGWGSIREEYNDLNDLFSQITANYEKKQLLIREGNSQEEIDMTILLEERLVAQLLIKSQSILGTSSALAEKTRAEELESQELANNLTFMLLAVIACVSAVTSFLVVKSISEPVEKLTKVIDEISKGKVDVEIDPELTQSKDEIGDLARAFDRTMVSLKFAMKKIKT